MKRTMFINLSLLLLLAAAAAGQMETTQCPVTPQHFVENNPVEAEVGSDALLPCRLKPGNMSTGDETLAWSKGDKEIYIISDKKPKVQDQTYNGRLSVSIEEFNKGNASLKLSGVKESDSGDYCCCISPRKNPLELRCTKATLVYTPAVELVQSKTNHNNGPQIAGSSGGCWLYLLVGVLVGVLATLTVCRYKNQTWTWVRGACCWTKPNTEGRQNIPGGEPLRNRGNNNEGNGIRCTMAFMVILFLSQSTMAQSTEECKVTGSPVRAEVGADVILPCHLEPRSNVSDKTVEWKRQERTVHRYRSKGDDVNAQDDEFKNRTSLFHDELSRGNISLKLTSVTLNDTGTYTCSVPKVCGQDNKGSVTFCVQNKREASEGKQTGDCAGSSGGCWLYLLVGVLVGVLIGGVLATPIVWFKDQIQTWVRGACCWTKPNTEGSQNIPGGEPLRNRGNNNEGNGIRQVMRRLNSNTESEQENSPEISPLINMRDIGIEENTDNEEAAPNE